jgi:hypothetical protein
MKPKELKQILKAHAKWVRGEAGGIKADLSEADLSLADLSLADLSGADLREADLSGADLREADLSGADLSGADLRLANLSGADLSLADLSGADLSGADLKEANLSGANLREALLREADLREADLSGADLREAHDIQYVLAQSSILPETGPIWGWKKCRSGVLVKLVVGNTAKRSNATGRKCRAEHVKVLEVIGAEVGISRYNPQVQYRVGEIVRCDKWNDDRWTECGGGIHFFLTKIEAERYSP